MSETLQELLEKSNRTLILDGPLGTELTRRGFDVDRPGWSARALVENPELVLQIHLDYVAAGANLLTANTFRTHAVNLKEWSPAQNARELTSIAVELAQQAAGNACLVCGSVSPLGDSYRPQTSLSEDWLIEQHEKMLDELTSVGVDILLVETQTTFRELKVILRLIEQYSIPTMLSVVSFDGLHLLDGTPLPDIAELVTRSKIVALGCNCVPVEIVNTVLNSLKDNQLPKIVYANSGYQNAEGTWFQSLGANLDEHTELAKSWIQQGVRILGGCCGTEVPLIAKFAEKFGEDSV